MQCNLQTYEQRIPNVDIPHATERLKKVAGWGKAHQGRQSHGNDPWLHGRRDHNFEAAVDGIHTEPVWAEMHMNNLELSWIELLSRSHRLAVYNLERLCRGLTCFHKASCMVYGTHKKINACIPLQTIWFVRLCSNQKRSAKIDKHIGK
jgi:hypothetical protein